MTTASVFKIEKKSGDVLRVTWADGSASEGTLDQFREEIARISDDPETARLLIIAWFLARSPDASNANVVEGKTLTFDLSAPNPIRIQ